MMGRECLVEIPSPSQTLFRHGIKHPDLWLWDAWTLAAGDSLHLFTLALARRNIKGEPIAPRDRNAYPFHIRRFLSNDQGQSWSDCGAYLEPSAAGAGVMAHNVWSGSAALVGNEVLFGFTGVRQASVDRSFLQSICLIRASADGAPPDPVDMFVISDPEADYDAIRAKGYYLGPRDSLGDNAGEEGGPILAWRDPFFLTRDDGVIDAFWAAKTGPASPAVAHARLTPRRKAGFGVELLEPITPPDGDEYTQAEVPKVYRTQANGYLMLLSACNRLREDQPDTEVVKELRLYRSAAPEGPWRPYCGDASVIPGATGLFGGSIASINEATGVATLVAPYTEMAEPALQLTFAPPIELDLSRSEATRRREARAVRRSV